MSLSLPFSYFIYTDLIRFEFRITQRGVQTRDHNRVRFSQIRKNRNTDITGYNNGNIYAWALANVRVTLFRHQPLAQENHVSYSNCQFPAKCYSNERRRNGRSGKILVESRTSSSRHTSLDTKSYPLTTVSLLRFLIEFREEHIDIFHSVAWNYDSCIQFLP